MPDIVTIYEPGDTFGTMTAAGRPRLYRVDDDGVPVEEPTTLRGLVQTKEDLHDGD
jgi:hypothetical protein